jgi:hypothetical protein
VPAAPTAPATESAAAEGAALDGTSASARPAFLVRPFLELEKRELAFFAKSSRLALVPTPELGVSAGGPRGSVAGATLSVLAGLQAGFGSTVHNVVRTAQKIPVPAVPGDADCAGRTRGVVERLCGWCDGAMTGTAGAPPGSAAPRGAFCAPCEPFARAGLFAHAGIKGDGVST